MAINQLIAGTSQNNQTQFSHKTATGLSKNNQISHQRSRKKKKNKNQRMASDDDPHKN